jgi:hypothetical protein
VHIDAFSTVLGTILAQLGEGIIDHPIYFSRKNISKGEHNYITTEREGLEMVYALQKFRHYLLGNLFNFFADHYDLKYLVNKHVLEDRVCKWFLLF